MYLEQVEIGKDAQGNPITEEREMFEGGDIIQLNRTENGPPFTYKTEFANGRQREFTVHPGEQWEVSYNVDPGDKLCNPDTKKIRDDFVNEMQRGDKPQWVFVRNDSLE